MFPKSARLLKRGDFLRVQRSRDYLLRESIAVNFRMGRGAIARLGITVSKKYGRAHHRNRFKRVVRALFRAKLADLPAGLEIEVRPRKKVTEMDEREWKREVCELFESAKSKAARGSEGHRRPRSGPCGSGKRKDISTDRPNSLSHR